MDDFAVGVPRDLHSFIILNNLLLLAPDFVHASCGPRSRCLLSPQLLQFPCGNELSHGEPSLPPVVHVLPKVLDRLHVCPRRPHQHSFLRQVQLWLSFKITEQELPRFGRQAEIVVVVVAEQAVCAALDPLVDPSAEERFGSVLGAVMA